MKGLRIVVAALAGLAASVSSANSYLAWTSNDYGAYESTFGAQQESRVIDSYGEGWQKYAQFLGRSDRWVWTQADSEVVYLFNEERRVNEKLVNFADPVGKRYSVTLNPCTNSAVLAEKGVSLTTAAGTFRDAVRLEFSGNCADGGLKQAWFAPAVGVVQWEEQSIKGPVQYSLVRGSIAGKAYPVAAIQLITDLPRAHLVLNGAQNINAGLTVVNNGNSDLNFRFDGGQEFEISLLALDGQVLNTWGANKRFVQGAHELIIKAGESRYFGGELAVQALSGEALEIGTYLLRVEMKGSHAPEGSVFVKEVLKVDAPLFIDRRMLPF